MDIAEALERVGLSGVDRRPVKAYSLGMRQRLGLAAALLRRELLILDEPTNGLDPEGIHEVRALLAELNAVGTTEPGLRDPGLGDHLRRGRFSINTAVITKRAFDTRNTVRDVVRHRSGMS